jgi:hypothetical protein
MSGSGFPIRITPVAPQLDPAKIEKIAKINAFM